MQIGISNDVVEKPRGAQEASWRSSASGTFKSCACHPHVANSAYLEPRLSKGRLTNLGISEAGRLSFCMQAYQSKI
jgi:hypothetical protein